MSKYTLIYKKNKSQEIYIEEIKEIGKDESLYFNKEYEDSLNLIKAIVDAQIKNGNNANYSCNNRILFTGQRGSGKTSVMRSLAKYLSNEKTIVQNTNKTVVTFSCLPMVDPSHFDNNNNILLTVITNMFSEAKKKMNKEKDGGDTAKREDLLKQFEKVFKSLDSIKSELSSYTLESLNRKSDAEDLKDKMKTLVDKYLLFQGHGEKSRLVLLIDDIDMSVSYAAEMLEQLRKYLELDNLIILMSANLGQLTNEMREKYSSAFQYTLKDSNQALSIDVEDLATKYLLKLFPTSRRINVERHVSQLLETDLVIKNEEDEVLFGGRSDEKIDKGNFQKVILSLIWKKTRLLFTLKDQDHTLHPIIPSNLRDLSQFLDVLVSLDSVNNRNENKLFEDMDAYNRCLKNNRVFKNYFMNTWIPNHLNVEEELVFHNIPTDITEINKHLINSINIIGTKHKDDLMSRQVGLDIIEKNADNVYIDRDIYTMVSPNDPKFVKANKISDIFNQPSNYSYGDLLLMIDKFETYFESEEHRKFTDAIKIYYSILLFETMFFESTKVRFKKEGEDGYTSLKEEDKVLPIQKLIGGTVYYPNYFEIIKDKYFNQKGPSYDAKRAFYHKVEVKKGKRVGENYPFFAVLYYGDIRPDRYDVKHIYDTTFDNDASIDRTDYVTFDILSILSNMLNPWHTYYRADEHVKEVDESWENKIDEWGKNVCTIQGVEEKLIPNSILPFYSVDMMLNYLKESFEVSKIVDTNEYPKEVYKKYDDFKVRGRECLFSLFESNRSNKLKEITDGLDQLRKTIIKSHIMNMICELESDNQTLNGLLDILEDSAKHKELKNKIKVYGRNSLVTKINKEIDWLNQDITVNNAKLGLEELRRKDVPDNYRLLYDKCVEILSQAIEIRGRLLEVPDPKSLDAHFKDAANYYLNSVISILLANYTVSQKERDSLIKELHKYATPSEIFKHLVESLWDNMMTEICIRSDIQEKVRKANSVGKYYDLLWDKTETLLNIDDDNAISIYRNIFNNAAKKFITKNHQDK